MNCYALVFSISSADVDINKCVVILLTNKSLTMVDSIEQGTVKQFFLNPRLHYITILKSLYKNVYNSKTNEFLFSREPHITFKRVNTTYTMVFDMLCSFRCRVLT